MNVATPQFHNRKVIEKGAYGLAVVARMDFIRAAEEQQLKKGTTFKGLLGISTYAGDSNLAKIPKRFPVRLLHGDEDTRVSCANALDSILEIQRRGGDAACTVVKGADHFLVLARRDAVGKFLHENIHQPAVGK